MKEKHEMEHLMYDLEVIYCEAWKYYLRTYRNELPLGHRHLVVPSGATKTIFEPMVRLVQTMHLSCTDANTTSKWKEERFHMTHDTKEFHWVHPKWFRSLWYVRRKPCTYLASRLALSPNVLKWASTWASSPSGTIGCDQNDLWAYGTSSANHAPILHRR